MSTTRNAVTIEAVGDHAITITREFDHPVDRVFRAMSDPALMARWIGPHGYENVELTYDARHAGSWTLVQRNPEGQQFGFRGVFHGDQAPEQSQRTFEWLGLPGRVSFETMRLVDLGGGRTRADGVSVFTCAEDRDGMLASGMEHGVVDGYERLDAVLQAL